MKINIFLSSKTFEKVTGIFAGMARKNEKCEDEDNILIYNDKCFMPLRAENSEQEAERFLVEIKILESVFDKKRIISYYNVLYVKTR